MNVRPIQAAVVRMRLRGLADPIDAASEHQPDRLGHLDLANRDLRKPFAGRIRQSALLGQMAIDLLDEEGHALGFGVRPAAPGVRVAPGRTRPRSIAATSTALSRLSVMRDQRRQPRQVLDGRA